MKKTSIQFSFDEEKLQAIHLYMKQKNASLETEAEDFFERMYKQYVPVNVRQFIDLKSEPLKNTAPKTMPQ